MNVQRLVWDNIRHILSIALKNYSTFIKGLKMKKLSFCSLACAIFVAALFSLVACNSVSENKKQESHELSIIITTIYPEYAWTKEILGTRTDSVNLTLLIKNGIDLHSYKPTAHDVAKIASADMVIYVGGESDEWIKDALTASPKKGRVEINLMEALGDRVKAEEIVEGMQAEEEHHHEHAEAHEADEHEHHAEKHEHHDHEHAEAHEEHEHHDEHAEAHEHHHHDEEVENDEHVWLSLKNAEILVKKIAEELSKIDAAHASAYKQNAEAYTAIDFLFAIWWTIMALSIMPRLLAVPPKARLALKLSHSSQEKWTANPSRQFSLSKTAMTKSQRQYLPQVKNPRTHKFSPSIQCSLSQKSK